MTTPDPHSLPRTVVPGGIIDPVQSARAELKAALAAIEQKANVARRTEEAVTRANVKVRAFAQRKPVTLAVAAVGVAAAVGTTVWGIARLIAR
ncbi:hypothetical protein [Microbacterium sp. YY-01]|uniref:hypothetical protein n=1 Tax=Microbacterium sp. YY-01 TaxID=3421634 RepID=UPI003D16F10A